MNRTTVLARTRRGGPPAAPRAPPPPRGAGAGGQISVWGYVWPPGGSGPGVLPGGGRSLFGRRSGRQYSPSIVGVGTRCGARGVGCGTCGSGSSVDAGRVVGRV